MDLMFRVLGPLEVRRGDVALDLGPRQQRMLLADLCVAVPRVVPTDRLLHDLWGDAADGKQKTLWVYISRLRSILEPDRGPGEDNQVIVTRDHGYALDVDPGVIDGVVFTREAERGAALVRSDPTEAAAVLRSALARWRGAALEEFADEAFARTEIARLEELRLAALGHRIDADLRLGRAGRLVAELEDLRRRHPHHEGFVAQQMLALYRSGRQADALRAFRTFRRGLADDLGLDPSPELARLEEKVLLHDERIQPPRRPARVDPASPLSSNPFKGLRPFEEADTEVFFGREPLVADVLRRIEDRATLVALVGPSGSGKSSVLRAGLVPALRKQDDVGPAPRWLVATMVPGAHPFVELAVALAQASLEVPDDLPEQLRDHDHGVLHAALRVLPDRQSRLLLVIDHLEELFTLVEDEDERHDFLDQLLPLLDDPHGRVVVVTAVRADLYARPLAYPTFGRRLGDAVVNVVDLLPDELESAAKEPAARAGVALEPALLAALVGDVLDQPGALPLFQYALTELFERRTGDVLTLAQYRTMGGIAGAVTTRADELFARLDEQHRAVARQLFLRLVAISDDGDLGRRRVTGGEILSLGLDAVAVQGVVERYVRHRLLTVDRDQATGAPTIEVAHESLLTEWDRLHGWIAASRDDLRRHARLRTAVREWQEADRRDGYLLRGARLADYAALAARGTLELTGDEHAFLEASVAARDAREASEAREVANRDRLVRSAKRRLWAVALLLVVALAGAAVALLFVMAGDPPRVALVGASPDDPIGNQAILGLEQAARQFDVRTETLVPVSDPEQELRALLDSAPDLVVMDTVFVLEAGLARVLPDLFDAHPDVAFAIYGADIGATAPNATQIVFAEAEGAFLAGAVAALQTETGVVGFLGGSPPSGIDRFRAGFEDGARYVDPQIGLRSAYLVGPVVNLFSDIALARRTAARLYDEGADVVFHAAGAAGVGVFDAAASVDRHQAWAMGVDTDQWLAADPDQRDHVLTSLVKRHDTAVTTAVASFLDDSLGGVLVLDVANEGFRIAESGGHLGPEVAARVDELRLAFAADEIAVGEVVDGPATAAADADLVWHVSFDGDQCHGDVPVGGSVEAGEQVTVELSNQSDDDASVALWPVPPGMGWRELQVLEEMWGATPADLPWTHAIAAPGRSHAITFELPTGATVPYHWQQELEVGSWAVWCESTTAVRGGPAGTFTVTPGPGS